MQGPSDMPQVVASAHDVLFHLSLTEDAPFEEPSEIALEFHGWAARNGYDTDGDELREMHVQSIMALDVRTAELVMEWAQDVYPDIFERSYGENASDDAAK